VRAMCVWADGGDGDALSRLLAYGIDDVNIETVPVLTNMPVQRVVEIVYPDNLRFQASLTEPVSCSPHSCVFET
jgi:hypothetical protein